jgi:integrase
MKFTKASVAALTLPPNTSDHFVWDDATPGFGVRLRGARRTWIAQLRVNGRTRRMSLGDVARIELEPARTAAKRFFAESTLGADPIKARQEARERAATTVESVVERYLATRETAARPSTLRHQQRYLRHYILPLHSKPIESVLRRDVALLIDDIAKQHGLSAAKHCRAVLSAFFAWALKQGIAGETNPCTHTNDPNPGAKPRERVLKPEEIRAIWQALPDNAYGQVVRLLFYTACRRVEIAALEWTEVDFDKALLVIPGYKMKGGYEHKLPLVPEAIEILRSIPRQADNPFVFGGRKGFNSFSHFNDELRKALHALGYVTEQWGLHDVRRTIRSEMGDLGVEPWIGEQVLAHRRGGIEAIYNLAKLEKQMRQALQLWADRLRAIVEGTESTVVPMRVPA